MDNGIIRIYKDMKHVKLFESFLEEKPRSIIIEITEEFKRRMKESKNSENISNEILKDLRRDYQYAIMAFFK